MKVWNTLFNDNSKNWNDFSAQMGFEFSHEGKFKPIKVTSRNDGWTIVMDTYTVSTGQSTHVYTRIRAPFLSVDGFRFKAYKKSFFSFFGKLFGLKDFETGFTEFDEKFILRGNDEEKVKLLFSDEVLHELLGRLPYFWFNIKNKEYIKGAKFPSEADVLCLQISGIEKSHDTMKAMFEVMELVLKRLCVVGAAYKGDVGVEL